MSANRAVRTAAALPERLAVVPSNNAAHTNAAPRNGPRANKGIASGECGGVFVYRANSMVTCRVIKTANPATQCFDVFQDFAFSNSL